MNFHTLEASVFQSSHKVRFSVSDEVYNDTVDQFMHYHVHHFDVAAGSDGADFNYPIHHCSDHLLSAE